MTFFSGLGIGLSLVFGCLLLALVAELYYLLWWKKKITNREVVEAEEVYSSNYAKEFFHFMCWKKATNITQDCVRNPEVVAAAENGQEPDLELGANKDLLTKAIAEESVESELMRLHNLSGPPRFLFTIKEETKEDLESEDGKSRADSRSRKGSRTRSLSDLILDVDAPFVTPLASPRLKPSPLKIPLDCYHHHGFNPLFESSSAEVELNRLRSSPPPKFKFLRDAEEKLIRKLVEEAEKRASKNGGSVRDSAVKALNSTTTVTDQDIMKGSFLGFIVGKNLPQYPSSSSQVLPLASSPTTFRSTRQEQNPALY